MLVPTLHRQHQCKLETTLALHCQSVHEVEVLQKIAYFFQAAFLHYQSVRLVGVLPEIALFCHAEVFLKNSHLAFVAAVHATKPSILNQMVLVTSGFPMEPGLHVLLVELVQDSVIVLAYQALLNSSSSHF